METLSQLTKTVTKGKRRVGRGYGSQKGGHTTGRGNKGDKIRGTTRITFDGTKIKKGWIKRTPFLRGKHRVLPQVVDYIFNLTDLEKWFSAGDTVSPETLAKKTGIDVRVLTGHVKILGNGTLTKKLKLSNIRASASVRSLTK